MFIENYVVVVPDGLRNTKKGCQFLTNTYRKSLLDAKKIAEVNNNYILLLPANNFGGALKEEEVASNFLVKKGFEAEKILIGLSSKKSYLDTYDNFHEVLINECKNIYGKIFKVSYALKDGKYTLVTSYLHIDRVLISIKLIGFKKPNKIFCSYAIETGYLPLRLIYYKWSYLRKIYELIAMVYFQFIKKLICIFKKQK